MKEVWKSIKGFDGYGVSNTGKVASFKSAPRLMTQTPCGPNKKYLGVCLYNKGGRHTKMVHRLVIEAFKGACPEGKQCDHKDTDTTNNNHTNLVWVTPKKNLSKAHPDHTQLTKTQVLKVIKMIRSGKHTDKEIYVRFKVSRSWLIKLKAGKAWSELPEVIKLVQDRSNGVLKTGSFKKGKT